MKTFLVNIPEKILQKSKSLDAKTILTKSTWEIFTDDGTTQLLIFKSNGELLVSTDGNVVKATWEYIPVNQDLLISVEDHSTLLRPAYKDDVFFALQKHGTSEYLFLIDEAVTQSMERTIEALEKYFNQLMLRVECPQASTPGRSQSEWEKQREAYRIKMEQDFEKKKDLIHPKRQKRLKIERSCAFIISIIFLILACFGNPKLMIMLSLIFFGIGLIFHECLIRIKELWVDDAVKQVFPPASAPN